jgi:hypothetical protein
MFHDRQIILAVGMLLLLGPFARADDQADARAIVEKSIKATGDLEKYVNHKGGLAKGKGTIHAMGMMIPFTMDYRFQFPGQSRAEIDADIMGMQLKVIEIVNGNKGWVKLGDAVSDMDENKLAESQTQLYTLIVTSLLPLRDKAFTLSTLGEAKVEGVDAVGVRVACPGKPDVSLFFDKRTSLLLKSQHRTKDSMAGGNEVEEETLYFDYQEKDGIKAAMKLKVKREGKLFIDFEAEEYASVEKQDEALFAKP